MTNLKKNYYDCLWEKYLSQTIKTFPKNWYNNLLSQNSNITWDIVQDNPDKDWCFFNLSKNPNITWEIVQANPDKDWRFHALSQNSNITWEIVKANPDKPWNYEKIFLNHIGKQKFIEKQLKAVNVISDWFIELKMKRAVNVLSDWFIELKTNPDSNLCKKWMKTVQSEFYNKNPWE